MSSSEPTPTVEIRSEQPVDVAAIAAVTGAAFAGAEHSAPPVRPGGPPGEVDLVEWLRADEGWIPELSLVAVLHDQVVGHVLCTRGLVDDAPALGLGPVSVRPDLQGRGIGDALIREVLARAAERGESLVALVGEPAYYGRFGFVPARTLGVEAPDPSYGEFFQALRLGPGPHPQGTFRYAAPFDRL
ncbi:GNAT family N-acetyltransferase [Nocardioides sp. Bht2]|uniref:GNAT family N-acetyltransferase n=1 Tax=Nocardioides sp. Bht2 TaxID=3392297 RepID=UPI0039B47291